MVGITGEPEEVRAYAELVKMAAELVIEHMVLIEQRQWDKRYREELINQLILRENSTESLRSMAAYLGIDLAVPRVVLIIELSQPDREALRNVMDYFENHARNHLVTFTEFNELIIIKPITLKEGKWNTRREMGELQILNHGLHHRALAVFCWGLFCRRDGIAPILLTARATQAMAKDKAAQPVHFYHDHALPALLSGLSESWQVQELSRLWLQLAQHDAKGVLQQTLRTGLNIIVT